MLARWASDGFRFPVDGESAFVKARALPRLPARILRDGADDRDTVLGLAANQHLGIGVSLVDQVLGGQQTAAAERAMNHFDHVVVRRRRRRSFDVGDQTRSRVVAALRKVNLVADP